MERILRQASPPPSLHAQAHFLLPRHGSLTSLLRCEARNCAQRRASWHPAAVARPILVLTCRASNQHEQGPPPSPPFPSDGEEEQGFENAGQTLIQVILWLLTGVYVVWLFLLPYAPGDPVWAIKLDTVSFLLDLSLNFFYVLPLMNKFGVYILESPSVHPTAEALFNLVMGWTFMFAPLLFTDRRRNRFTGSLVLLWAVQMFLTNTVLLPYMAIRLNQKHKQQRNLASADARGMMGLMTSGAWAVGLVGGTIGLLSVIWFVWGRPDGGFGGFSDRWNFFLEYLASDRLGYAFIWDICLYSLFQPWLIGDNLPNVERGKVEVVKALRFIPCVGLSVYLWGLENSTSKEDATV